MISKRIWPDSSQITLCGKGRLRRFVVDDRRRRRRGLAALAARQAELFQQLCRDFRGVLALRIAAAPEEFSAPAAADDHRLAALVAVDVGRIVVEVRLAVAGGGGVGADDL